MRIDAFLRQSPIVQTSRAARKMEASLNLVLQEEGVSVFEALMLAAIFFEKRGEIKPSALAESFETTRGNVSHCISSLEAKGLVARQIDPNDARAVQLLLKPQGRRRVVRVMGILGAC
jgi:DNA-binding MarR family transcriptional regulator